ncbi:MAG: hypothetical protein K0S08_120 [Gammaproteobacteria bacterium]|jgi:hypothetical protein|nr:hypothetical protein [Gammaproteobacteria bacterium]
MIDPELAVLLPQREKQSILLSAENIKHAGEDLITEIISNFPYSDEEENIQANLLINYYLDPSKRMIHINTAIEALNRLESSQQKKTCCCFWRPRSSLTLIQAWIKHFYESIEKRAVQLTEKPGLKMRSLHALAKSYQMQLVDVEHDGNCFYSAIAKGLHVTGGQHAVREATANDMLKNREAREQFLNTYHISFTETLSSINAEGQWASQAEIMMTAYALNINLVIVSPSFKQPHIIAQNSQSETVVLAYYEDFHYALLAGNIPDAIQKLLQAECPQNTNSLSV